MAVNINNPGKRRQKPQEYFDAEGDLFARSFDKAESFAMQNVQRITKVGKLFADSFSNFQSNFDTNTKKFRIAQKKVFKEREEALIETFSGTEALTGDKLLESFGQLKQYMDDANITIEEFTFRVDKGGDNLKKTFDSVQKSMDENEKKQAKLRRAGVATEQKVIDGKIELVALTKSEIFEKQELMQTLEKENEESLKQLQRLEKKGDLDEKDLELRIEYLDNIEKNNDEIREIQDQGIKNLKDLDKNVFGQFGRDMGEKYRELRGNLDKNIDAFLPGPVANVVKGFVDAAEQLVATVADFMKPFKLIFLPLKKAFFMFTDFFVEKFPKITEALNKGFNKMGGVIKKLLLGFAKLLIAVIAIPVAILAIIAAISFAVLKIKNFIDDLLGTGTVSEDDIGDDALLEKDDGTKETKAEAVKRINDDIKENKELQARPNEQKIEEDQERIQERIESGETFMEKHVLNADEQRNIGMQLDMMAGHSGYQSGGSEQVYRPNGAQGPGIYSVNRSTGKMHLLKSLREIIEENKTQFEDYSRDVLDEDTRLNMFERKMITVGTSDIKEDAFKDEFKRMKAAEEIKEAELKKAEEEKGSNNNLQVNSNQDNSQKADVINTGVSVDNKNDNKKKDSSSMKD